MTGTAPHGAGRIMSRRAAFGNLSMDEYREEMKGIFTTSVTEETLDGSSMTYKSIESIVSHITTTVELMMQIKPVYKFKTGE